MSDTPRTDAETSIKREDSRYAYEQSELVSSDFARQLERELNELRAENERLRALQLALAVMALRRTNLARA